VIYIVRISEVIICDTEIRINVLIKNKKALRYQRDNQNPYIEEGQTTQ